jgi:hypothetical protein
MKTNIYVTGNYITVSDIDTLTGLAKNVLFQMVREIDGEKYYSVLNLPGRAPNNLIPFSDIRKQDDSAYTEQEWETFITEETGKSELNVMPEASYNAIENKENKLYFTY